MFSLQRSLMAVQIEETDAKEEVVWCCYSATKPGWGGWGGYLYKYKTCLTLTTKTAVRILFSDQLSTFVSFNHDHNLSMNSVAWTKPNPKQRWQIRNWDEILFVMVIRILKGSDKLIQYLSEILFILNNSVPRQLHPMLAFSANAGRSVSSEGGK